MVGDKYSASDESAQFSGQGILVCCSFDVVQVSSASMEPTLRDGDYLVIFAPRQPVTTLFRFQRLLRRNMIVVFRSPIPAKDDLLVKRIVGLSPDQLRIDKGTLWRDAVRINEPYVWYPALSLRTKDSWPRTEQRESFGFPVPRGELFVMGDNRLQSLDSRLFGSIPDSAVVGVVVLTIPANSFRW